MLLAKLTPPTSLHIWPLASLLSVFGCFHTLRLSPTFPSLVHILGIGTLWLHDSDLVGHLLACAEPHYWIEFVDSLVDYYFEPGDSCLHRTKRKTSSGLKQILLPPNMNRASYACDVMNLVNVLFVISSPTGNCMAGMSVERDGRERERDAPD